MKKNSVLKSKQAAKPAKSIKAKTKRGAILNEKVKFLESEKLSPQSDLIAGDGKKPLPSATKQFASAVQLRGITGLDDSALRRLGNPNLEPSINPKTGAPWILKPVNGLYDVNATIIGVLAWHIHRAQNGDSVPRVFGTIGDFNNFAGWPPAVLDHLRKLNPACVRPGHRPDLLEIFKTIGQVGAGGFERINGADEMARLTKERADEQAMLNAKHRGELLFSKDKLTAVSELAVTEVLFDQFLAPFKKDLLEHLKRAPLTLTDLTALLAKYEKNLPAEITENQIN